jgi:Tripartite tricarboxylate transporter TctB family
MSSQPESTRPVRFTSTVILSLTFLVIFSSAVLVAKLSYPPEAASMPLIVGGVGAALSLLQLIRELRASRSATYEEQINLRKDVPIYLWVWSFVIAIVAFGFVIAAPVMLFAYLRLRSREPWWLCVTLSLSVLALLYGLFAMALGVPLFEGLATPQIEDWLTSSGAPNG